MQIDLVQVVTNLFVGAISAWISGGLGVHRALQQTKQQRGFDRRLEWYEKAVRTISKFRLLFEEVSIAVRNNNLEMFHRVVSQQQETLTSLQQIVDEAMVFADRETLLRLNRVLREYGNRIRKMKPADPKNLSEVLQEYDGIAKLMERACLDLASSIRCHLGLDPITMQDLEQ